MSTVSAALMTAEEFFEWCHRPENRDRHFELARGKVVEMPNPGERHGLVCANTTRILGNFTVQQRKGYVLSNDTGILWEGAPDTVRGPDVVVDDKKRRYDDLLLKYREEAPQLIAEVLSPTDHFPKVLRRVTEFLRKGVAVGWIIDPESRTVTIVLLNEFPKVLEDNDELTGAPPFPELRLRVADLFFMPE